jgi:hypothetical protein
MVQVLYQYGGAGHIDSLIPNVRFTQHFGLTAAKIDLRQLTNFAEMNILQK